MIDVFSKISEIYSTEILKIGSLEELLLKLKIIEFEGERNEEILGKFVLTGKIEI